MTIENEKTRLISNDELMQDIRNTELELSAYQKIADGFRALSSLPENAGQNASMLSFSADQYRDKEQRCADFLRQLHALQAERGIS